jgi:hypothetical protein
MSRIPKYLVLMLVTVALTALGCGGGGSSPTVPNDSPTPIATPTPTPTPVPYEPPLHGTADCWVDEPIFEALVFTTIGEIENDLPEWFDYDTMPGWTKVLQPESLMKELVDRINAKPPYSADFYWREPWADISVKEDDENSENWRILSSFNTLQKKYMEVCEPAEF